MPDFDASDGDGQGPSASEAWIDRDASGDGTLLIVVDGELTILSAPSLEARLRTAFPGMFDHVIVDLTNCTFIDSTGLNCLVRTNQLFDGTTARLALVVTHPHLLRVLGLTHADDVLALYADRAAALQGRHRPRLPTTDGGRARESTSTTTGQGERDDAS